MEKTANILRRSFHTFFHNYQYLTSIVAFLFLPVSVSVLLSQAVEFSSFPLLATILTRLESLFDAAGFPSSQFFFLLNLKLSQTITSFFFTLPFTLSFLLVAKSAIILALHHKTSLSPSFSSLFSLYNPLLLTYLCNSLFIFAAHATGLCILILLFNSFDALGYSSLYVHFFLSAGGAVVYSLILANTLIISNLALVVAGMENCGGFMAILKACVLIRGRASTALSLALPVNLGLAFLEALLQCRLVRAYYLSGKLRSSAAFEGLVIAYLYSLLILGETIISCIFYKSCKSGLQISGEDRYSHYRIENMEEEEDGFSTNLKISHEFP